MRRGDQQSASKQMWNDGNTVLEKIHSRTGMMVNRVITLSKVMAVDHAVHRLKRLSALMRTEVARQYDSMGTRRARSSSVTGLWCWKKWVRSTWTAGAREGSSGRCRPRLEHPGRWLFPHTAAGRRLHTSCRQFLVAVQRRFIRHAASQEALRPSRPLARCASRMMHCCKRHHHRHRTKPAILFTEKMASNETAVSPKAGRPMRYEAALGSHPTLRHLLPRSRGVLGSESE
jgi:hypothetical protein